MHFLERCAIILWHVRKRLHAPIAQLDRVTDYESVGRGFESLSAYQKYGIGFRLSHIFYTPTGLEESNCNSPVDCCRRRLDGGEPLFSFASAKENANEALRRTFAKQIKTSSLRLIHGGRDHSRQTHSVGMGLPAIFFGISRLKCGKRTDCHVAALLAMTRESRWCSIGRTHKCVPY